MRGKLIPDRQNLITHTEGKARKQMKEKGERQIAESLLPDGDIPEKRIELINNARPERTRNTDTIPNTTTTTKRRKIAPTKQIACQSAVGRIFPEPTDQDHNYDEMQNRKITHIPVAQPQLEETKRPNITNAHTSPDRTYEPSSLDNTGKDKKHTGQLKSLSQKSVTQPKKHDVGGMDYDNPNSTEYNAAKPTMQEHMARKPKRR